MKRIQLVAARIRNFKGIKEFEFNGNGESVEVYGQNGTGKTSIVDAFTWCLFGKDSQDRKEFQVKPVDENNQEIHHLETEVEMELRIDGETKTLKRLMYEKYSKRNGLDEPSTFKDEMKYYVDDVPIKTLKEYTGAVNGIISDQLFKLLTNPTYFNELKWEDRRKVLIDMLGEITVDEVIARNKDLEPLAALLNGKTPEEVRLINADRKSALTKDKDSIPARIDEVYRSIPVLDASVEESQQQSQQFQKQIDDLQAQRIAVQSGAAIATKRAELSTVDAEISVYRNNLQATVEEREAAVQMTERKLVRFQDEAALLQRKINNFQQKVIDKTNERDAARQMYREANKNVYVAPQEECECPTCKQSLPVEQVEQVRQKALESFNLRKASQLDAIKKTGEQLTGEIEAATQMIQTTLYELEQVQVQIAEVEKTLAQFRKELEKAQGALVQAKESVPDITQDARYLELMQQRAAINGDLTNLQTQNNEVLMDLDQEIMKLRNEKQTIDANLTAFADVQVKQQRIAQLEAELTGIYESLESIDHVTHLLNEFDRKKIALLDSRISEKFKIARFKLYHEQKNGGLAPTCETLYNGVSYQNGLNTAAKINIGLDIIEALQRHHAVAAPIFIDNRESVTKLLDIDTQLISLIVSANDEKLRIERVSSPEMDGQDSFKEVV